MSQIKRNEGTRESKTFTRRGLQAEHQTGITRQKQNFAALADRSKNKRERERERGSSAAFLNVSGKGWREKVPELYEKPNKKSELEEEAEEMEAAEE